MGFNNEKTGPITLFGHFSYLINCKLPLLNFNSLTNNFVNTKLRLPVVFHVLSEGQLQKPTDFGGRRQQEANAQSNCSLLPSKQNSPYKFKLNVILEVRREQGLHEASCGNNGQMKYRATIYTDLKKRRKILTAYSYIAFSKRWKYFGRMKQDLSISCRDIPLFLPLPLCIISRTFLSFSNKVMSNSTDGMIMAKAAQLCLVLSVTE